MPEFIVDTFSTESAPAVVTVNYEDMSDELLVSMLAGGDTEAGAVLAARDKEMP